MSSARNLINQQYGTFLWKSYDDIIKRFRCSNLEHYSQIVPSDNDIADTPIFACKFAQQKGYKHLLALANEDGKLAIHDTTNKEERYGIRAHNNAIFDIAWMFDNMKIVTAAGDHTVALFDVSNADIQKVKTFHGHSRSVKTVSFRKDDPSVFATGGRDGNIIIWDIRTEAGSFIGKPDRTIFNSHNTKTTPSKSRKKCICASPSTASGAKSVTGLVFQDENTLISCGAGDGIIKIWDLRKNYLFCKHEPVAKSKIPYSGTTTKNGFSNLMIDKDSLKLYANCLDNTIYTYNLSTYNTEPIMKYTGHQNSTFFIKSCLNRNGDYLISGSSDENAYVWNTKSSTPIAKLVGHSAEVTCVAWCENDDFTVVTCSDDMTHKIWRVGTEITPENWEGIGEGQAEVIPLDSQLKRKADQQISSISKKTILPCARCDSPSTNRVCLSCSATQSKRKRSTDSDSEESGQSKRFQGDFGPRCLFKKEKEPTTSKELETVAEDKDKETTQESNQLAISLPNFVMDGVAPHINYSPPKRKSQDWLTKMRIERQFRRDIFNSNASESSSSGYPLAKIPKLEITPKRCSPPQSPILRFFKVKCDGHPGPNKSINSSNSNNSNNLLVSSPRSSQS